MTSKPRNGGLLNKHIAITRPAEQAKKLAELITNAGGTPILFPLIEITPLADYALFDAALSQIEDYDWAIFISSNAVQNGMPRLLKKGIPKNLKFAAIGAITAKELASFGAKHVLFPTEKSDSEALLALPEMFKAKKVMIFRGVGGREILAETLKARGATVTFAECYQRTNPQKNCEVLAQLYTEKKLHGIVVTSSEAMRHLIDLAGDEDWLKNTPIFVNHARVAEQPLALGLTVHVAETAGDEAMLTTITNSFIFYFAYGSNMLTARLKKRITSAEKLTSGCLAKHTLLWHKVSKKDGSGKCDIQITGNQEDVVYGVVYIISRADKPILDKYEGLNNGYDEKEVQINVGDKVIKAFTYFATNTNPSIIPFTWYKKLVIAGANEHCLPIPYINKLETVPAKSDTDSTRENNELAILNQKLNSD